MKQIKLTFVAMLLSVTLGVLLFTGSNTYKAKRTIYVDQANGNDSNTGISFSEAFKTIKKATEIISPGDICIVEKGNYPERVYISRSGNKNNLITFKAAESGVITKGFTVEADYIRIEEFEITGTDPKSWKNGAGIHLKGKYCEILNNYIHNVYLEGIRLGADLVSPETSNCLVKANRMIRCGQAGIQVGGQKNVIDSNEISGTIQWAKTNPQKLDADGMRYFGSGHIIRRNYIHDIVLSDPENSASPHIDCAQTWGPAENIIFEQNNFSLGEPKKNKQIAMITEKAAPVRNIIFRNNYFHDTYRGINVHGSYETGHPSPINNVSIINNTFVDFTEDVIELHDSPESKVINNIFYNCRAIYIDQKTSQSNLLIGYNSYYTQGEGVPIKGIKPAENDLWNVDPGFKNIQKGNFKLNSNSPLIGRGKNIPDIKDDFNGKKRTGNNGFDIGAINSKE